MTSRRRRYLVYVDGMWRHTHYTPEQTATVCQLLAAGTSLDATAAHTGIAYSSLRYVAAMQHKSRVLHVEDTP
jgi:hypothetical protein